MHHSSKPEQPGAPRRALRHAVSWRTLKYGSHTSLFTAIVLAVAGFLYIIVQQHTWRVDVTRAQRFTLASQSVKLLQELTQPLHVVGFFKLEDNQRRQFEDLLKQYTYHTEKLSYEVIDPDRQPAQTQHYKVTAYNTVVVVGNNKTEQIFRLQEEALTNAMVKVTRDTNKVVYFVTGHGEPSLTDSERTGYSLAKQYLDQQNYTVRDLLLARQQQVPEDAAVVVVAGPRQNPLEPELQALHAFLKHGGNLLLLLDPDTAPALTTFVQHYGLELHPDVVIETNALGRLVGGDYLMPVVMTYEPHPITKDFGNIMTMFPVVRSVQVASESPAGISGQGLVSTSPESWAETDLTTLKEGQSTFDTAHDRQGPISIAAVVTITPQDEAAQAAVETTTPEGQAKTPQARLVVFGDSEFANNSFFTASPGNGNLFLNTVSWLAEEEDLIAIRPRKGNTSGPVLLTAAQAPLIFWLPVVIWPLAVLATGAMVYVRRRWQQ